MFSQSTHTILFVTCDTIARADLLVGRSISVLASHCSKRQEFTELSEAVQHAFALGSRHRAQVWIVADEFWSGCVVLHNEVVNAVAKEQLSQTLALEAEYDSGISPFESKLGYLQLPDAKPDERRFWITQAEASQYESVVAAIPKWTGPALGFATRRLEVPGSADSPSAASDLTNRPLSQMTEAEIGELALLWLTKAMAKPSGIPLIQVEKPAPSIVQKRRQSGLIAGVAFLLCAVHFGLVSQQRLRLDAAVKSLVEQETQLRKHIEVTERRHRALATELKDGQQAQAAEAKLIAARQQRAAEHEAARKFAALLLNALSNTASDQHSISRIELDSRQTVIFGVAIHGQAVANFAKSLNVCLTESGDSAAWAVAPPEMSSAGTHSLVSFKLTLKPGSTPRWRVTDERSRGGYAH